MMGAAVQVLSVACLGEIGVSLTGLPIPGPAVGMLALVAIMRSGHFRTEMERLFDRMAPMFPLFFVPSAVGFVGQLDALETSWMSVVFAVVAGTAAAVAIAGLVFQAAIGVLRQEYPA